MNNDQTITIYRTSQYACMLRKYNIYIDKAKADVISDGEKKLIYLPDGTHEIYLKIDFCTSKKLVFDLHKGENINFECGSRIKGFKLFISLFFLFIKDQWVYLERKA